MNPILLDTHAAVWSANGSLQKGTAATLDAAAREGRLLLSPITAWEIAMLVAKRRLHLALPVQDYVRALFGQTGIVTATLTPAIAAAAAALPAGFPDDPADRILFATAQTYGAHLVTRDKAIRAFADLSKAVRCIAC